MNSFAEKWAKLSQSNKAFFVLHIVLIVLMIPSFIIAFTFRKDPPDGFFETEEDKDDYESFTKVLEGVTLTGTIVTFLFSAFSIFVVLQQSSGVFSCNACTSVINMIVLLICALVPLISVGAFSSTCADVKDDCYKCNSDSNSECKLNAAIEGFDCYYTDEDYDFVCVETTGKLGYVSASFFIGIVLELAFSIISCMSCTAIKKGYEDIK